MDYSTRRRLRRLKRNRSIPSASVIPVLVYPDVRAAVEFLQGAFGFAERVRIGEDHRSQLSFGDGAVIVGDVRWIFSETLRDVEPEEWGGTTQAG